MSVGDVARFTSVVNTEGRWESEPSGVLEVDHDQGVVVARRMGHARLRLRSGETSAGYSRDNVYVVGARMASCQSEGSSVCLGSCNVESGNCPSVSANKSQPVPGCCFLCKSVKIYDAK